MRETDPVASTSYANTPDLPDCVDIRQSIYLRIGASAVGQLNIESQMSGAALEYAAFQRLFPSICAEAALWYGAGKGRGLVLWKRSSMQYIPASCIGAMLRSTRVETRLAAVEATATYDPLREAVVAMLIDGVESIARVEADDTPLRALRKLTGHSRSCSLQHRRAIT
ncbi:MAG: hypothetical protein LC130_04165 [Bryobacterales bacterium]|nr:hypothetical protein [Bryobacterales bacterium]